MYAARGIFADNFWNLFEPANLFFPAFGGLLPECSVILIDRPPCQLSAFFGLSLEKYLAVEH
jgi:hypothetical protein